MLKVLKVLKVLYFSLSHVPEPAGRTALLSTFLYYV